MTTLPDGNALFSQFCSDLGIHPITFIVKSARWVHPKTFEYLPLWYPESFRGMPAYNAAYNSQRKNGKRGTMVLEQNINAAKALKRALGVESDASWTCCHLWGFDNDFNKKNEVVADPRFYSCIANMVYLPTPIKTFSDSIPQIKEMLRICSYYMYGWTCEHESAQVFAEKIKSGYLPEGYPIEWPTAQRKVLAPGTMLFSDQVKKNADKRLSEIAALLKQHHANPNFPLQQVVDTMNFWKMKTPRDVFEAA